MKLPSLDSLEQATRLVHEVMPPTPQFCWPRLSQRMGAEVWVKHENHTPVGAFKIRGGLVYFEELKRNKPEVAGVIAATQCSADVRFPSPVSAFGKPAAITATSNS